MALNAADVEYGIQRGLDPARPGVSVSLFYVLEGAQDYALGRSADASAVGVRALDARTVEFRLLAPAPYFLSLVNRPDAGPLPRHAAFTDEGSIDLVINPSLELRRALAMAIDRAAIAEVLPGAAWPFDPEAARASLKQSGFEGRVTLTAPAGSNRVIDLIARSWQEVLGDRVQVRLLSPEAWSTVDADGIGDVALMGWTPGYPDPEYFLRLLLHSASTDNFGRWSHPAFDALIEQARAEPDGSKRLDLFHRADRLAVTDQVALIPIAYICEVFRVSPRVRGWWTYGKSWSSYADLAIDPTA